MRTNIILDDQLIKTAMKVSGHKTKKATVEEGLRLLIRIRKQEKIRHWRGKILWEGNLEKMRLDN